MSDEWRKDTSGYERGMTDATYLSYKVSDIPDSRIENVATVRAEQHGETDVEGFVEGFTDLYHEIRD